MAPKRPHDKSGTPRPPVRSTNTSRRPFTIRTSISRPTTGIRPPRLRVQSPDTRKGHLEGIKFPRLTARNRRLRRPHLNTTNPRLKRTRLSTRNQRLKFPLLSTEGTRLKLVLLSTKDRELPSTPAPIKTRR